MNISTINCFECVVDTVRNDTNQCYYVKTIQDNSVKFTVPISDRMFTSMNLNVGDSCFIFFNPSDVYVVKPSNKWSYASSNTFEGSLVERRECKENSVVTMKVGENVTIQAKISNYVCDKMGLSMDDKLDVVIKSNQIMIARNKSE